MKGRIDNRRSNLRNVREFDKERGQKNNLQTVRAPSTLMTSESISLEVHGDNKWVELGVWPRLGRERGGMRGESSDSRVCGSQGDGTIPTQRTKKTQTRLYTHRV